MTTFAQARATLVTAVGASDDIGAPPIIQVYSQGSDLGAHLARGQILWRFRVACAVGYQSDNAGASSALALVTVPILVILRALAGWSVESLSPDVLRSIGGGEHLSADIIVSTWIDL